MIESSHRYRGLYYVLMVRLAPLEGVGPQELQFDRLVKRDSDGIVREVILATNFTAEGETTAHYLSELLRAKGLPVGGLESGVDGNNPGWNPVHYSPAVIPLSPRKTTTI